MTDETIEEDGIEWEGTPEELDAWIAHKRQKALHFVERGYSVEWSPNPDHWMTVYLPQRHHEHQPEIRASIQFYSEGSKYGIDGGRISKLHIQRRLTDLIKEVVTGGGPVQDTLFNYDRGSDVDRLDEDERAKSLYDIVVHELN